MDAGAMRSAGAARPQRRQRRGARAARSRSKPSAATTRRCARAARTGTSGCGSSKRGCRARSFPEVLFYYRRRADSMSRVMSAAGYPLPLHTGPRPPRAVLSSAHRRGRGTEGGRDRRSPPRGDSAQNRADTLARAVARPGARRARSGAARKSSASGRWSRPGRTANGLRRSWPLRARRLRGCGQSWAASRMTGAILRCGSSKSGRRSRIWSDACLMRHQPVIA